MIIVILGPTGIGKTKLSIALAKDYRAIIINGDAVQIYKGLNIGSAKITEEEKEGVPHYLFDVKNPNEDYSVADYQKDLRNLLNKFKDKNIIIVGGTGLYIKSALYDYKFAKLEINDYSRYTNEELLKMCLKKDKNCQIHVNNRPRLENFLNKKEISSNGNTLLYNAKFIGLTTNREKLYEIIDKRVDKMIENGLIEEVKTLYNKYPNANILKRAIGYKEIIKFLNNEISLEEAVALIKKNSRHYAKRQYTWNNNQMNISWFETNLDNFDITVKSVIKYLDNE